MKILFLIGSLGPGGKERQLVELIKGLLQEKNYECELGGKRKRIHYKEIFEKNIRINYYTRNSSRDIKIFFKIYKLCKEFKPDIIHTWDLIISLFAFPTAKFSGIKFVNGYIRNASPVKTFSKLWFISKFIFKYSDAIVANSLPGLKAYKLKVSEKNYCIPNGFDFSRVENLEDSGEIKRKFSINTKFIIGMVGNFTDAKDYITYLISAKKLLKENLDITFICIGDGPTLKNMKQLIDPKYKEHIKFFGQISEVESIINIVDIGVLTCNTNGYAEGNSNAIMEYMALGKPVIATKSGGNKELIIDNVTGYLIKPFAVVELVEKIKILLKSKSKREKMGERGRERIRDNFSLDNMVVSYKKLYEKLLNTE